MKLLSRKTVINEVADQKRQAIDEGLQIARKVDKLRETLASLEKQHADFLVRMQSELKETSDKLLNEIALRKLEIVQLDSKRKAMLKPLDEAWAQVNAQQGVNTETRDILAKGLIKLADKQKKLDENYEESKKTKARINVQERELLKAYEKVKENENDTDEIKKKGLDKMVKIDKYITEKNKEIDAREIEITFRDNQSKQLASSLEQEREDIIKEKAQLKDQRASLVRAFARLKTKK